MAWAEVLSIENKGMLIPACSLDGETRGDDVAPGNCNCAQVSRNRWVIVYQTRSWWGVDDERSIIYQIRKDAPDGPVVKEGFLSQAIKDWDPLHDGNRNLRQHGHPVIYGVPKGAMIDGKPAPNANLFVVNWRVVAIAYDAEAKKIIHRNTTLHDKTQGVEWMQFRLNETEDNLVIAQPRTLFRQKGFETGASVCSAQAGYMNQTFTGPVPFNHACTEWAVVDHFDHSRLAAVKVAFNASRNLYEFVETGPLTPADNRKLIEASLARVGNRWVVAGRNASNPPGIWWGQTDDPFKEMPVLAADKTVASNSPFTFFMCGDGTPRLFTGDVQASPYHNGRCPLYMWDVSVKPDGVSFANRQVVFDAFKAGLKFRQAVQPRVDFGALFPAHGKTQILAYRVFPRSYNFKYENRDIPPIDAEEKPRCGLYYTVLHYDKAPPAPWKFGDSE